MARMIKSKREWRCSACGYSQIKWSGKCVDCGSIGKIQEFVLIPTKKITAQKHTKTLIRRSKKSEQTIAKHMVEVDGPDLQYEKIASSIGRIGHITNIRADAISKKYLTENKNRLLPNWLTSAWLLINQRAVDFNKEPLLHLDPPNSPKEFPINGTFKKLQTMHVITQSRHDDLIHKERDLATILQVMSTDKPNLYKLREIRQIVGLQSTKKT